MCGLLTDFSVGVGGLNAIENGPIRVLKVWTVWGLADCGTRWRVWHAKRIRLVGYLCLLSSVLLRSGILVPETLLLMIVVEQFLLGLNHTGV